MVEDSYKKQDDIGAPFNMAVASLMRIHDILKDITKYSMSSFNTNMPPGPIQHMKYRLVRQLYVQSVPLMKNDDKGPLVKELDSIQLKREVTPTGVVTELYDHEVEKKLDQLICKIEEALQVQGYFMPPKSDPRFGWAEK